MIQHRFSTRVRIASSFVVAAFVLVAGVSTASAGPWVKPPGKAYLKLSGEFFSSQTTYDLKGKAMDAMPAYSHFGARHYAEIGVAPRVSIGWSLPFLSARNSLDDGRDFRRTGLGDLDLRASVQIFKSTCAMSGTLEGRIPLYGDTVGVGDQATASMSGSGASRYEPILGDGSHELTPTLAFGCGFDLPGWATVSAGPKFRFDGFGDGIEWSAGAGVYAIPDRLAFQLGASGLERFTARDPRPTKRYIKARAGVLVEIAGGFSVEGGAGYTLDGAFVSRGWSGALGISYQGRLFPNPYGGGD